VEWRGVEWRGEEWSGEEGSGGEWRSNGRDMIIGNKTWIRKGRLREYDRSGEGGNGAEMGKDKNENRMWRERKIKLLQQWRITYREMNRRDWKVGV
jgi:hypothetical protein